MKLKSISLLLVSALGVSAQSGLDWFTCYQNIIPSYKCTQGTAPSSGIVVVAPGTTACAPGKAYSTIGAAVTAAAAGSTIKVCPGTYAEQVLLTKPVSLVGVVCSNKYPILVPPSGGVQPGPMPLETSLAGTPVAAQIAVVGPSKGTISVNVSNLKLDGAGNGLNDCSSHLFGIYYQNASGSINNNVVQNETVPACGGDTGYGIYVESGFTTSGTSNVSISNNVVFNYQDNGITADGFGTTAQVSGNYVALPAGGNAFSPNAIIFVSAAGTICNNVVANAAYTGDPTTGVGTGVVIIAADGLTVSGNTITGSDFGIITLSDGTVSPNNQDGSANNTSITANSIDGKGSSYPANDGIDACSNGNTITANEISNTKNSGIHLDSNCPLTDAPVSGTKNNVQLNTANTVCAGVAEGSGGNLVWFNTASNASTVIFGGDTCVGSTSNATLLNSNSNFLDFMTNYAFLSLSKSLNGWNGPQMIVNTHCHR